MLDLRGRSPEYVDAIVWMNIEALDDIHSRNLDDVPTTCIKLNQVLSNLPFLVMDFSFPFAGGNYRECFDSGPSHFLET